MIKNKSGKKNNYTVLPPVEAKGLVTLPAQNHADKLVSGFIKRLKADAVRDSDGTKLSPELMKTPLEKYTTICLVRSDQDYAVKHPESHHRKFILSEYHTATGAPLSIDPLAGYYRKKYCLDLAAEAMKWWQVIDRTSGRVLERCEWVFDETGEKVRVPEPQLYHAYSASVMVRQIWDSTSMYNHMVNGWEGEPVISLDPYLTETGRHLDSWFDNWLSEHSHTDVVRLTTLAYSFVLDSDQKGEDRYRDWTGYLETVSPAALADFTTQTGISLSAEDFLQAGLLCATDVPPSKKYLAWMEFVQTFVFHFGKNLVNRIHDAGKKAGIFWGDHWIGVEPYGRRYDDLGIDIHIGACEDGVALRRLADCPAEGVKEIRLYPYFFPDVFNSDAPSDAGAKSAPLVESESNWMKIRRAVLRRQVDRIGWGGYLSLAAEFPDFTAHMEKIADEFRTIKNITGGTAAWNHPVKIGVVSSWGSLRSWFNPFGRDQPFLVKRPDVTAIAGSNILECLAGLPFAVSFLSFSDIEASGIPEDLSVLILHGEAESVWSGGRVWDSEALVARFRSFVDGGGGLIGCQEPSAFWKQGRQFQLYDVFGLDCETGRTPMKNSPAIETVQSHFITEDYPAAELINTGKSYVFACEPGCRVLLTAEGSRHVQAAVNEYGAGRAVYFSSLPYSIHSSRLLYRAVLWAAGMEEHVDSWCTDNPAAECHYFPEAGVFSLSNLSPQPQTASVGIPQQERFQTELGPYEIKWYSSE